jgi:hypothetical protein
VAPAGGGAPDGPRPTADLGWIAPAALGILLLSVVTFAGLYYRVRRQLKQHSGGSPEAPPLDP